MSIENRNLEPGTQLIARYRKQEYHALVIAGADGKVRYTLTPDDGKEYRSPSSLGTAVTGKSCNGWAFWSLNTDAASAEPTDTAQAVDAEVTTVADPIEEDAIEAVYVPLEEENDPPTTPAPFRRVPNQRGVTKARSGSIATPAATASSSPRTRTRRPVPWDTCPASHTTASPDHHAGSRNRELASLSLPASLPFPLPRAAGPGMTTDTAWPILPTPNTTHTMKQSWMPSRVWAWMAQ